jgi:hypothetical protein
MQRSAISSIRLKRNRGIGSFTLHSRRREGACMQLNAAHSAVKTLRGVLFRQRPHCFHLSLKCSRCPEFASSRASRISRGHTSSPFALNVLKQVFEPGVGAVNACVKDDTHKSRSSYTASGARASCKPLLARHCALSSRFYAM